jgi:EAL and modified HD-GYP domain-containing signal transduction protein
MASITTKHHYAARQPILTEDEKVFGYELLFRDGTEDYFSSPDPDAATRSVLDTSTLLGLDILCDSRCAFINCTREILLNDYVMLLPPEQLVVEVLETVPPDDQVRAACNRLKKAGYRIALDDFSLNDPREPLTDLADIIKVDIRSVSAKDSLAMVKRYGSPHCLMLAEKVETRQEFHAAKEAGFSYFQGYFFRRPERMQAREIPANRAVYLRLLQAISRPELDTDEMEQAIKMEASLTYRLLRYLNSAAFGFSSEIQSVRHALTILGEHELRRWVHLAATLVAAQDKPSDLVLSALVRARFSELLGERIPHGSSDLFLAGLLSLMDAILEVPMYVVVDGIALDRETRAVLIGDHSRLTPVYELMLAQEEAEWEKVAKLSAQMHLTDDFVAKSHWSAMRWAHQITGMA